MNVQESKSGITFAVHEVEKATQPLPTLKTHLALKQLVGFDIESCCDYTSDCIANVGFHPLLAAAHFSYCEHRPIVFSPDMIWVTIVQGAAQHVRNNAERLRHRFVGHEGKLDIRIEREDIHRGSPENAWDEVIHNFSVAIRGHLGETHDRLIADFSTTGPIERIACEVALLDMFQPYFEFIMVGICGIPEVTLEGTTDDWKRLREKVENLAGFDLDWWLPAVRSICDQFVRASAGDIDLAHWRDFYKQERAYGGAVVNGWLVKLVPYLKNGLTGNFSVRNPLLDDPEAIISTSELPTGVSQVPFRCRWSGRTEEDAMEMLGGFLGVTQDPTTLALRSKLGWAVRKGTAFDQLLSRLSAHDPEPPLDAPDFDRCIQGMKSDRFPDEMPGDFLLFYKKCNGVQLRIDGGDPFYRFRDLASVEIIQEIRTEPKVEMEDMVCIRDSGPCARFCDLADGTFLALELKHHYPKGWKIIWGGTVGAETTGLSPIVAWSFEGILRRALEGESLDREPPS